MWPWIWKRPRSHHGTISSQFTVKVVKYFASNISVLLMLTSGELFKYFSLSIAMLENYVLCFEKEKNGHQPLL